MKIELVVFDMAGTTVADGGAVEAAFTAAIADQGVDVGSSRYERMLSYVRDTMGQSKIEVFRALLDGDENAAQAANEAFEKHYAEGVRAGGCVPVGGAEDVLKSLRANGVTVALTTGFAPVTQQVILETLGWQQIADIVLAPAQGVRGRPWPDMVLACALRAAVSDVRAVAVVGDTPSDIRTGVRAGASIVAGVRTGAGVDADLLAAGATQVLDSVAELPAVLSARSDG